MKVLILYHSSNQAVLMDSMCKHLNKIGICSDSFDTTKLRMFSPKGHKKPFCVWLYKKLMKLPHGKNFIERHFFYRLIRRVAKDYDIIDVQSLFKPMYGYLVPQFKRMGKKVKIHIWGTDFYKYSFEPNHAKWQTVALRDADIIHVATETMKSDFINRFPEFTSKIRTGVFGNQHLDDLMEFAKNPERTDLSFVKENCQNKIIVTCGYNARSRHQHLKMIDAIDKLPRNIQDRIFVVFPMTYLRENAYLTQVQTALNKVHFKYAIINDFLSENQLFSLRSLTDLYINVIKSDALSSSTQEHLFSGNVVIVGDWLPYNIFEENGLFYIKTSLTKLYDNIHYAIAHIDELKKRCTENPKRL